MSSVQLYPHQIDAVKWMRRTENRPRMVPEQPHGGILAHAMGLGKTISMLWMILEQGIGSTLVVCPKSVLAQWKEEAVRVLGIAPETIIVYHGPLRHTMLRNSSASTRLVVTTFDIVRLDHGSSNAETASLNTEYWDRIVLDEAHRICEQTSKTARAIRSLRARNRWCVTGTPFKNGVTDLVALSKFLLVPPYCNSTWWRCHSQNRHKVREWRNTFLNMQDKSVLSLPPTSIVKTATTRNDAEDWVMKSLQSAQLMSVPGISRNVAVLTEEEAADMRACGGVPQQEHELLKILRLRQAANHPLMLATPAAMHQLLQNGPSRTGCNACAVSMVQERGKKRVRTLACTHRLCKTCRDDMIVCPCCVAEKLPAVHSPCGAKWLHSSKTAALWTYLANVFAERPTDKVVLFSQWTTCLDLLQRMLTIMGIPTARFDGRINSMEERSSIILDFKNRANCRVLLTSLGAGGEGLNLTFASHVILMEPYWNCAVEQQAIDRLHRIGQTQVTHVVKLVMKDSVEDWVQEIQQKKTKELERLLCGKEPLDSNMRPCGRVTAAQASGGNEHVLNAKARFNEPFVVPSRCDGPSVGLMRFLVQ